MVQMIMFHTYSGDNEQSCLGRPRNGAHPGSVLAPETPEAFWRKGRNLEKEHVYACKDTLMQILK